MEQNRNSNIKPHLYGRLISFTMVPKQFNGESFEQMVLQQLRIQGEKGTLMPVSNHSQILILRWTQGLNMKKRKHFQKKTQETISPTLGQVNISQDPESTYHKKKKKQINQISSKLKLLLIKQYYEESEKRETTDMEKIFTRHISDKGLYSEYMKDSYKIREKKTNRPTAKVNKRFKQVCHKGRHMNDQKPKKQQSTS